MEDDIVVQSLHHKSDIGSKKMEKKSQFPVTSVVKTVSNCREMTRFACFDMTQSIFLYNLRYFSGF